MNRKNLFTLIIGIIIGNILTGIGVYATTILSSSEVSYDNSKSGGNSNNVQGAIDELYEKANSCKSEESGSSGNFISAYTYSTEKATKCITGEEETCNETDCYKTKTENSCKAGDIIKYKVNDTDIVTFHVMFDEGSTMTMQSQRNTINGIEWYADARVSNKGPLTVLPALENATASWSNVNNQTYEMGTTNLSGKGVYTGCNKDTSCTKNTYTLESRTARARMITIQEAVALGCGLENKSSPAWLINYLDVSASYGGTVNDISGGSGYWTMTAYSSDTRNCWYVADFGQIRDNWTDSNKVGARAVVVVNK